MQRQVEYLVLRVAGMPMQHVLDRRATDQLQSVPPPLLIVAVITTHAGDISKCPACVARPDRVCCAIGPGLTRIASNWIGCLALGGLALRVEKEKRCVRLQQYPWV